MRGKKVHVRDGVIPDRLICGRRAVGLRIVALDACETRKNLCGKCRQQTAWARVLEQLRCAPLPAGYQYEFRTDPAWLARRRKIAS